MRITELIFFLLCSIETFAQFTQVTGTVTDPNGLAYANGTIAPKLVLPGGQSARLNGLPYTPPSQPVGLSSVGAFLMQLADNTILLPGGSQWSFTVCSGAGTVQPAGGRGPVCFNAGPITISGVSQDISTTLNAAALALTTPISTTGLLPGGASGSIQTNQTGTFGSIANVGAGSWLVSQGTGTAPAFQQKQVIDARDISGVDCTGASDSSTALNAQTGIDGITGKILSFRGCKQIKLVNQWLIKGEQFATIDFGGYFSQVSNTGLATQGGVDIIGCPTSNQADSMIRVDDTGFSGFSGGSFEAQGAACGFSFAGSLRITNSQTGGYTSSRDRFDNMFFTSTANGTQIANYYGVKLDGAPNQEGMGFHHILSNCQNSSGSIGVWINAGNADSTSLDQESHVVGCKWGVRVDQGTLRVRDSHIGGNGSFSVFGAGGANFYEANNGCLQEISNITSAETSGAWLTGGTTNGAGTVGCRRSIFDNNVGFPNIDPALYLLQLCGGSASIWSNNFTNGGAAQAIHNNTVIGCDTNGLAGPQAEVFDLGNNITIGGTAYNFISQTFNTASAINYGETHLGHTFSPIVNVGASPGGTSNDWALLPATGNNGGGPQAYPSARLIFARSLFNATFPVYDQFTLASVGASGGNYVTLPIAYKQAPGYTVIPYLAFQPAISGSTYVQAATPTGNPIGNTIQPQGAAGTTNYSYVLVARAGCGTSAASATFSTTTGNATLSTTNFNLIQFEATAGAWGFDIYRTVCGSASGVCSTNPTGKIGTILATDYGNQGIGYMRFNDTGLAGDATTAPSSNTSGCLTIPTGSYLAPPVTALANQATCTSANEGSTPVATNCNAACTVGGTCTAGGAVHCQLYCNGSAYIETGR